MWFLGVVSDVNFCEWIFLFWVFDDVVEVGYLFFDIVRFIGIVCVFKGVVLEYMCVVFSGCIEVSLRGFVWLSMMGMINDGCDISVKSFV